MKSVCLFAALAIALAACSKAPESTMPTTGSAAPPAVAAATPVSADVEDGIAWRTGDVDMAFAAANSAHKPVFLYWGAKWCPPCNQIKATVFNRQDFIERSRHFVPVYIDGDSPNAQRLGSRFKVSGYPTMILFTPGGAEITRLPGDVDAEQYMQVLAMGMNGARPMKETLAGALAPGAPGLSPDDWRMLSFYSWEVDDQQLVAKAELAPTLQRLASACPADQPESATRLKLQALAAFATAKDVKPRDDKDGAAALHKVLVDPKVARANFGVLTNYADDLAKYVTLPKSAERAQLVADWNGALARLIADPSLSTADRLTAVTAQVKLASINGGTAALPPSLQQSVREQAARADRETTDPYARGAVISTAADALEEAGLMAESDAMLTAELTRSQSPYYYMLGLAANARKRGDKAGALAWYEKAHAAADGPATRLQWGASYVSALVELSPQDAARIEAVATQVVGELKPTPDTFFGRNQKSLERLGRKLEAWNKGNEHAASLQKVRGQMAGVCGKLPSGDPARAACDGALWPAKATPS
ncbi:MAG TPA: thioredoxin family protein [Casimicrobiaceae bacterium]|nr:thioredoxin family protein [Casimicrobiaceae bacterium]